MNTWHTALTAFAVGACDEGLCAARDNVVDVMTAHHHHHRRRIGVHF